MQPSPCVMNKGKWTEEEKALLVDGMSRDLDPAQGVWEYFCGSCLAHLNPREYAHIYSPSQISRISEFFVKRRKYLGSKLRQFKPLMTVLASIDGT